MNVNISNSQSPDVDQFYLTFGHSGIVPSLVAVLGFKSLLALLAFCSNLSLFWLTLRSPSLHSNCNWLIALNSLNIVIFTVGPFPAFLLALSGINFIPIRVCLPLQALPFCSFIAQIFFCLSIGLDRLISVIFPIFYRRMLYNRRLYVLFVAMFSYFYSLISLFNIVLNIQHDPYRPVMCSTTDIAFVGSMAIATGFVDLLLPLNLATPLCYIVLGIVLLRFKLNPNHSQLTRQIFKAIFVLMLLQLFGWLLNQLLQNVIKMCQMDAVTIWFVRNIGAFPLYITLALDAPTLYFLSQDYRMAFMHFYGPWAQFFCKFPVPHRVNSVGTTGGGIININHNNNVPSTIQVHTNPRQQQHQQQQQQQR